MLAQLGGSRLMVRQLAHEIKNPLGGLRGAAQLLERELLDPGLREYTRVIISEADRLTHLLDSMLGPGRPPAKQLINVHELLERVYHLLRSEAPEGVIVDRDYDPSLPALTVDPNHIIQAMLNLGRNAIQALAGARVESPRLTLRTRVAGNVGVGGRRHRLVATIQFEDNGPGVAPEIRDTIFYPLVSGRTDGTGLGLGIAQDLVSRHGGLIEFDSAPGPNDFRDLSSDGRCMNSKPLQVWLVDDDASIRWVLEKALKGGGMSARCFDQADNALTALRTEAPDVLMTDIRMPGQQRPRSAQGHSGIAARACRSSS